MFEPSILNYFLVILGGFGFVWSFRRYTKQQPKNIGEFEYASFSALAGIPIFVLFSQIFKDMPNFWNIATSIPMMLTPILFFIGFVSGAIFAWVWNLISRIQKSSKRVG